MLYLVRRKDTRLSNRTRKDSHLVEDYKKGNVAGVVLCRDSKRLVTKETL